MDDYSRGIRAKVDRVIETAIDPLYRNLSDLWHYNPIPVRGRLAVISWWCQYGRYDNGLMATPIPFLSEAERARPCPYPVRSIHGWGTNCPFGSLQALMVPCIHVSPIERFARRYRGIEWDHQPPAVIPAEAGIHLEISGWAPAFAGVTIERVGDAVASALVVRGCAALRTSPRGLRKGGGGRGSFLIGYPHLTVSAKAPPSDVPVVGRVLAPWI